VSDNSTTQCLLFPDIFAQPLALRFDQRQGSSDGGALLLKAADRGYGLIGCLAGCLRDERQAGKVDHSLKELLAQRVFSIACGYPDANDAARLATDPIHKMLRAAIRERAAIWLRSRRCRVLRTPSEPRNFIVWARRWPPA
jgi:hypothetical protein